MEFNAHDPLSGQCNNSLIIEDTWHRMASYDTDSGNGVSPVQLPTRHYPVDIVKWTHINTFQLNSNRGIIISIQENLFEKVTCKRVT